MQVSLSPQVKFGSQARQGAEAARPAGGRPDKIELARQELAKGIGIAKWQGK